MKIEEDILEKIVAGVRARLQSFHSRKRQARIHAVKFMKFFTDVEREFLIKEVLHSQNKTIIKAIADRKNIAVPSLGTFQYREIYEAIRDITAEVKAKYNVSGPMNKIDPTLAEIIHNEIEEKKKEIVIDLYYKGVGGRGSTVNHNFKNQ